MKKYLSVLIVFSMLVSMLAGFSVNAETGLSLPVVAAVEASEHGSDVLITAGKTPESVHFTWTSDAEGAEYLQYTTADKLVNGAMPADAVTLEAVKEEGSTVSYTCRVLVSDLCSNSSYSYRVGSDSIGWSPVYTYDISDKTDGNFSFLFAGDPQIGAGSESRDIRAWNTALDNADNWFGGDIDFLMSAGDLVNKRSNTVQQKGFASPSWLRSNMLVTAPGNHDNGAGYSDCFTYTDNDDSTTADSGIYGGDYWIEYEGCLIMALNLNKNSVTAHSDYMRRAVEEYKALYGAPKWTIVTFHQSIYSAGKRAEDSGNIDKRERLAPVISELGVDVVLSAHDHTYTRSYMINGNTVIDSESRYTDGYGAYNNPSEGDVLYITASTATGCKYYDLYTEQMPFSCVASEENVPGIVKVDITGDSMTFATYRIGPDNNIGDRMDFFAIHRDLDKDTTPPMLNVPSETYVSSADFDLGAGITAYDNSDRDLSASVKISGKVDMNNESTVTYTVTDKAGNATTKQRKLIPVAEATVIADEQTEWRYSDDVNPPAGDWKAVDYDDSSWKSAVGSFGAKKGEVNEVGGIIPENLLQQYYPEGHANAGDNIPNYFFRCEFDVPDPESVIKLTGSFNFDDGCNIYINGVLAAKYNTEEIGEEYGYNDDTSSSAEPAYIDIDDKELISSLGLNEKGNVMAVQLYQTDSASSDMFFAMKKLTVTSIPAAEPYVNPFTDVKDDHWFAESVEYCVKKGYVKGMTETTFAPNGKLTRAQFLTMLAALDGADLERYSAAASGFDDVKANHWFNKVVCWAVEEGITSGLSADKFGPNNNVTRAQVARFFYVYSEKRGISVDGRADISVFPDASSVQSWAKTSVEWAVDAGLISGVAKDGISYLDPNGTATRAQATVMFKGFDDFRN